MPSKTNEEIYQKKTQHEHILTRPDMYIGTIERLNEEVWVYDEATERMVLKRISWVPGLYKIFDEILVNAADNKQRDERQSRIEVTINTEKGFISVFNNGEGIPVAMHKKHNIWIPEMIFGHLLTSSNYNDAEAKTTGGRNGFGAKLTNVYSTRFEVETVHNKSRKKFFMRWENNMLAPQQAEITPCTDVDDYTKVTFWPDFAKFNMTHFEEDIVLLMKRRVFDIAGCSDKSMKCKLNGKTIPIRTFQDYVEKFIPGGIPDKNAYSRVNERWEVCICPSASGFQQVSFVNSILTMRGGTHVNYIVGQILDKVMAAAKKKKKDIELKPHMIKNHMFVFINCLIENPGFDSQTKETLNTTRARFGSSCELPESMLNYIMKSPIFTASLELANNKITRQLQATARGTVSTINVPKLDDANFAGTKRSSDCTLILTEGDSAKALAVAGISEVGKDYFGVYPLRGKPLNVRDVSMKRISTCEEIQAIIKIVGLKIGTKYETVDGLRYGRIMIMSDQDHDGSHIKGLIINFIHHFWPSLFKLPGFLSEFVTPIVKAFPLDRRGRDDTLTKSFFSLPDFLEWRNQYTSEELKRRYRIKYYKGLGTSDNKEAQDYFRRYRDHRIQFRHIDDQDEARIVMAFAKDKIAERKEWISGYSTEAPPNVNYSVKTLRYRDFVDQELIQFSVADCERSIPCIIDGMKPGQRKILYCCFKRKMTRDKEVKVAQFAGYVSEHSAYHHGEASLCSTIVNMAQDFVGANNLALLKRCGQFGTRAAGGKDASQPRYIHTTLNDFTRLIFHPDDDDILTYRDDDGFPVEPFHYVPIIPIVLVNGSSGIGTGYSTNIPNYNPLDVIANLKRQIAGEELFPMTPWYFGFTGQFDDLGGGRFASRGRLEIQENGVVSISELPIGTWTDKYETMLKEMRDKGIILRFNNNKTTWTVQFDILFHPDVLQMWRNAGCLEDKLELKEYVAATNLYGYDEKGKLTKYESPLSVLKSFYIVRLKYYEMRKDYLLGELDYNVERSNNIVRFILAVLDGQLIISRRKKVELLEELKAKGYKAFPPRSKKKLTSTAVEEADDANNNNNANNEDADPEGGSRDYDYLLTLPLWSLTYEKVERMKAKLNELRAERQRVADTPSKEFWMQDLAKLEAGIKAYYNEQQREIDNERRKPRSRLQMLQRIPELAQGVRDHLQRELDKKMPKEARQPGEKKEHAKSKKKKRKGSDEEDDFFGSDNDSSTSSDSSNSSDDAVSKVTRTTTAAPTESKAGAKPRKPKQPKKKKKKKGSDDDEDDSSEEDDSEVEKPKRRAPRAKKSPADGAGDDGDKPKRPPRPKKGDTAASSVAPSEKAPPRKATRSEPTGSAAAKKEEDDDEFDLDSFGLGAIGGAKPSVAAAGGSLPVVKEEMRKPRFSDEEIDELLLLGEESPAAPARPKAASLTPAADGPKPAVKPAAARKPPAKPQKKRRRDDDSSGEDESSSDGSSSSSTESDSSDFDFDA